MSGRLVEPGRPEELAAALRRVLGDERLRREQGKAARHLVSQGFGARAWSQRLLALYSELCGRAPGTTASSPTEEERCASPW